LGGAVSANPGVVSAKPWAVSALLTRFHVGAMAHYMKAQRSEIKPRWIGIKEAAPYSGVSERLIENWIAGGFVRSSCVRAPGKKRGRRLIDLRSLDEFIESGVGASADLEMNSPTKKAPARN
jgi:hypothetical protein